MNSLLRAGALACAAAAGAVHAQSSVTLYGVVDVGIQYEDGLNADTTRVVSSGRSGSRLGFRGTEDLGGGLAAIFTLESGINADNGSIAQGGRFFGRQASVGLTGGWGTVAAGRFGTFGSGTGTFDMFGPIDPFTASWGTATIGSSMSSANALRVSNAVLYRTPDMAGFQAGVLHSLQAIADAEVSPRGANVYLTGLGLRYAAGPFYAAITYDQANNPAGGPDEKHLQIGATYDFKVVRVHGAYAREKDLFSADLNTSGTTNGADAKAWMLGLSAPLGGGNLVTSYQRRDGEALGGEKRDLRVWALGYEYFLSKRSSLYGVVADEDGRNTLANMAGFNRRQYTAGVLHKF